MLKNSARRSVAVGLLRSASAVSPLLALIATEARAQSRPSSPGGPYSASAWSALEASARGQTVFFNAWGGSERVNAYLQWVASEVATRFGITFRHVKVADIAEAVKRIRLEKEAGKTSGGSVDMMWINGENFLTMKREAMLFGPFAESLPNFALVDVVGKPTTRLDFAEPTNGLEAPWGMAQFTLYADSKRVSAPPTSAAALAKFASDFSGRVTYPRPPAFLGTTFLKQILMELSPSTAEFYKPYDKAKFDSLTAPLWKYLEALHPHLWRQGKTFPANPAALRQLFSDGELLLGMTFNPNEAANEITAKRFVESVVSWQPTNGSIGNTHFLAIPFNSSASAASQVVINFMLSATAQGRKGDLRVWGDPTVLAVDKLSAADKQMFSYAPLPGQVTNYQRVIPEPHGSWVEPLEQRWLQQFGA